MSQRWPSWIYFIKTKTYNDAEWTELDMFAASFLYACALEPLAHYPSLDVPCSILAIADAVVLSLNLMSIITMRRSLITLTLLGNTILRVPIIVALIRTVVLAVIGYVYFLTIIFSSLAIVFYASLCLQLQKLSRLSTTGVRVTMQRIPQQQFISTTTVPITVITASSPQTSAPAYFGRPPPAYPAAPLL